MTTIIIQPKYRDSKIAEEQISGYTNMITKETKLTNNILKMVF